MYTEKLIKSGNMYEYSTYSIPVKFKDFSKKIIKTQKQLSIFEQLQEKKRIQNISINRTKTQLIRLVNCNNDLNKFITLTFRQPIQDLTQANYELKKFIQRLKTTYPQLKYIAVPEFTKKGNIHYHLLTNNKYIKSQFLEQIWKNGFIKINKTRDQYNLSFYISKYLTKNNFDIRYFNKKKYFFSKNLLRSIITIGIKAKNFFDSHLKEITTNFEKWYKNTVNNWIFYRVYHLKLKL